MYREFGAKPACCAAAQAGIPFFQEYQDFYVSCPEILRDGKRCEQSGIAT